MDLTPTLPSWAISPLLILLMIFIGSTIHANHLSLWESTELSIISIFAFIITISMLRRAPAVTTFCGDENDAENQFDKTIKIIHQENGPQTVSETIKEGKEPLPVSKPQVDRISILDPILGAWALQDKERAEAKAATAAAEEKEAKNLKKQKESKSLKKKDGLKKKSVTRDQATSGGGLVVCEEIFLDGFPNPEVLDDGDNSIKDVKDASFSLQESTLNKYLATLEGSTDAAFIERSKISINAFIEKLCEAGPSKGPDIIGAEEVKGPDIIEAEEVKAPITTIENSPLSRPKIEWGGSKKAMIPMKQSTPVGLKKIDFGFLKKEYKMGELKKKVVSTPLRFKDSNKDDKITDTIIKVPIESTAEPVKKPEFKNNDEAQVKLEVETSQEPREQPAGVVAAPVPVANEAKETLELEKPSSPVIPGEKEIAQEVCKILKTRPRKKNSWKAKNGPSKPAKASKVVLTPLVVELERSGELQESQTNETLPTTTTPPIEQGQTEVTVEPVEIAVAPALAVETLAVETLAVETLAVEAPAAEALAVDNILADITLETSQEHAEVTAKSIGAITPAVEAQFPEDLPLEAQVIEDVPDQNNLEVLEVSSPDLAEQLSAALEELDDIPPLESVPQSTGGKEQRPAEIAFDDSDDLCQSFLNLMNGSIKPKAVLESWSPDEISALDGIVPQLITDPGANATEYSSGQACEAVGFPTANDEQTIGDDDFMNFLQNFDDNTVGVISLEGLNFATASNEGSVQLTGPDFDPNFELKNIDSDSIFSEILENGDTVPEDHMDVYQPIGMYTGVQENIAGRVMSEALSFENAYAAGANKGGQQEAMDQTISETLSFGYTYTADISSGGRQDVADQIMSEALPSTNPPAAGGMEIDEIELSEDELFHQAILAAEESINGDILVNSTQMVTRPMVNIEPQKQESGIGLSEEEEFLKQMLLAEIAKMDREALVGQTQVVLEPAPGTVDARIQNQKHEDMLSHQPLLGSTAPGQTRTAPERVFAIPVPASIRSQRKRNRVNNGFQFGMPQDGFVPNLDTSKFTAWPRTVQNFYDPEAKYNLVVFPHQSFIPKQPVEQLTPAPAASNIFTTEPTIGEASFSGTASPKLSIQDTALFLLELTQGALIAGPPTEPTEPHAREAFISRGDVELISPKVMEKTLTPEPLTPVTLSQESFIPQLAVYQSVLAAITQETLRPQLTTQDTPEPAIEQPSPAAQVLDTLKLIQPQPLQEPETWVFQATNVPQSILDAENGVSITTDGIKLDTPPPSIDTCTNLSFTLTAPQHAISATNVSIVNIDGMKVDYPQQFTQPAIGTSFASPQHALIKDDASPLTIDGIGVGIPQTPAEIVSDTTPSPPSTPRSISSTIDDTSSVTTDGMGLEILQKLTEPIINPTPTLIFTLKATEKTGSKRRVKADDSNDEGNTQSMIEVKAPINRPTIPLRQKGLILPVPRVESAPETREPKKPISTSGIKIIMKAPTEPGSEIALTKRSKTHVPTVPDGPQVEPNYDCAKANMQKQLNKTTTKLQAAVMEHSIAVARQKGMEIDDNGFFQLGPKNRPRRRR